MVMYLHDWRQLEREITIAIVDSVVSPHIKMNVVTKLALTVAAAIRQGIPTRTDSDI